MKESIYNNYNDLPLVLTAEMVSKILGISLSRGYELMHEPGFPVLRDGSRVVAP
ncbi:DNA-binding protein [uncultured Dysosmobacter sp.]|uniref:DNA-binding protein n=1 Tax=uncultured Dysosmobacter sp. TaxID=2591384 RepID=UPI002601CDBB|nr:DNA-binding protein [uncultured Dysosmobacter sp.]